MIIINKVFLIGRTTKDIELKSTQTGKQYVQFTLAVDDGKNKDGTDRPTNFITCVAWDKKAEILNVYVHKGNRIALEGKWRVDVYQDEMGNNKYKNYLLIQNLEFLESKPKDNFVPQEPYQNGQQTITEQQEQDPFEQFGQQVELTDNDFPF